MRRALIIANSEYSNEDLDRVEIKASARDILGIVSAKLYGAFSTRIQSDLGAEQIASTLSEFSLLCSDEDEVLIYLIGHGGVDQNDNFQFYGANYGCSQKHSAPNDAINSHQFLLAINEIRCNNLVIILDCCFARKLVEVPKEGIAFPNVIGNVEFLTSGNQSYEAFTDGRRCILSGEITKLIQSGRSAGPNRFLTCSQLFQSLQLGIVSSLEVVPIYRKISNGDRLTASISKNPNSAKQLPTELIERLYSGNPIESRAALGSIQEMAHLQNLTSIRRAIELISDFSHTVKTTTPDLYDQSRALLGNLRKLEQEGDISEYAKVVIYTPQSYFWVVITHPLSARASSRECLADLGKWIGTDQACCVDDGSDCSVGLGRPLGAEAVGDLAVYHRRS